MGGIWAWAADRAKGGHYAGPYRPEMRRFFLDTALPAADDSTPRRANAEGPITPRQKPFGESSSESVAERPAWTAAPSSADRAVGA
ncbi:protein of unknown function [Micropruina glycogenica]|uniref:Uncharacterized protein n=1 Tax=Micropruina glycogenica TaxID=75385 RepID=A0A2N9JEA8_9ACTN|nr:protein of unknown function [Micropruina glycogenica]